MIRVNFSILSGGEQLAVSRLTAKQQNGKDLKPGERRFLSDMQSRAVARMRFKNHKKQNSFPLPGAWN